MADQSQNKLKISSKTIMSRVIIRQQKAMASIKQENIRTAAKLQKYFKMHIKMVQKPIMCNTKKLNNKWADCGIIGT